MARRWRDTGFEQVWAAWLLTLSLFSGPWLGMIADAAECAEHEEPGGCCPEDDDGDACSLGCDLCACCRLVPPSSVASESLAVDIRAEGPIPDGTDQRLAPGVSARVYRPPRPQLA